jgi:hypothetical protein
MNLQGGSKMRKKKARKKREECYNNYSKMRMRM